MKLKSLTILSIGLMFILIPLMSYSQDICFTQDDSKRLVVELERGRLLEKNVSLLEQQNEELVKQTEILKKQNELLREQFQIANDLMKKKDELYKLKTDVLENELKESKKPRWGSLFGTFGLGAATAFALMLLL